MTGWPTKILGLLCAALLAPIVGADAPKPDRFTFATLENGAAVGFALLRTGGSPSSASIDEVAVPRSNSVSRVLIDQASGTYFGYRLEVDRLQARQQFRVTFKPLASNIEPELSRRVGCSKCPPLKLLEPLPRYPAPRTLADGDFLTLDLLVNSATGEKIVDVVKVSSATIAPGTMATMAARLTEAFAAVQRAETLAARKDYQAAAQEYERALAIHPNDAVLHNRLGMCWQRSERLGDAERQYQAALEINPNFAEVWNNLGTLQHSREKYKQAIKSYQKAVSLRPNLAGAYKNMGSAYFAMSRFDAGFEAFQSAYRLDPTIFDTATGVVVGGGGVNAATQNFYFAKICAAAGQVEQALDFLRKAVAAGFCDFARVKGDPDLKLLLDDPRYQQLVRDSARCKG